MLWLVVILSGIVLVSYYCEHCRALFGVQMGGSCSGTSLLPKGYTISTLCNACLAHQRKTNSCRARVLRPVWPLGGWPWTKHFLAPTPLPLLASPSPLAPIQCQYHLPLVDRPGTDWIYHAPVPGPHPGPNLCPGTDCPSWLSPIPRRTFPLAQSSKPVISSTLSIHVSTRSTSSNFSFVSLIRHHLTPHPVQSILRSLKFTSENF